MIRSAHDTWQVLQWEVYTWRIPCYVSLNYCQRDSPHMPYVYGINNPKESITVHSNLDRPPHLIFGLGYPQLHSKIMNQRCRHVAGSHRE